eukprot:3864664-Amphidinium_carterae.1
MFSKVPITETCKVEKAQRIQLRRKSLQAISQFLGTVTNKSTPLPHVVTIFHKQYSGYESKFNRCACQQAMILHLACRQMIVSSIHRSIEGAKPF